MPDPAGLILGLPGSGLDGADIRGKWWWGLIISNNSPLEFVFVDIIIYISSYLSVIDGLCRVFVLGSVADGCQNIKQKLFCIPQMNIDILVKI